MCVLQNALVRILFFELVLLACCMQAAFDDSMSMTTTVNKALPVSLMFVMTCMYCGIMDNAVGEVTGKAPVQWTSRCTNTGKALNSTCMTCKLVL